MKLLVTGSTGQIGHALIDELADIGEIVAPGREQLDLTDVRSIRQLVRDIRPDVLINAAAYTAVDRAETEHELAMAVNGAAPGVMAEEMERRGGLLLHYSTDYVFDGTKSTPYTESDPPNPINAYGASKLAGEVAIQATAGNYAILRTSWVYGSRGTNFLLTMLRLLRERPQVSVVDDQIGTPNWCRWLARATVDLLRGYRVGSDRRQLLHLSASGVTSWFGFASAIGEWLGSQQRVATIVPITTSQYPTAARRPRNSQLSNVELLQLGIACPHWSELLQQCLHERRMVGQ